VALVALLSLSGMLGTLLLPWLLANAPLGLIVLTPALQHVVLTAPLIDPVLLISVATARRVLSLLSFYWLGGLYGYRVVRWIERQSPTAGAYVRWIERLIMRFGMVALVVFPIHTVSGLAGAAGMNVWRFIVAISLGQLVHIGASVIFGEAISEWTTPFITMVTEHLLEATAVCGVLVAGNLLIGRWRTGRWGFALGRVEPSE
jgi:uncharacterized membrane protein YdjX (TVP38/TMEM64 family)